MVVKANIVKNKTIGVDLNQKAGGFNAPVQSVNSKTGDVVLNANDVGADPEGTAEEKVAEHNTDTEAHNDIRVLVQDLTEAIPDWAKQPTKPTYTYNEVGADEAGTAVATVNAHNESETAHNDIRTLIQGLSERLNAVANSTDTDLDQLAELVAYIKANRELIEGVTTNKVNVSDIINNLTTNASNKPLSAAQGAALKGLINDLENSKANQTELEDLSEWTHQAVDEIVEFVSKDSNIESAFNLVSSDTLSWNGNTEGKVSVYSAGNILYVQVSSTIPTVEDLQTGGICAWIGSEDCPFVSGDIVETSDYIIPEIYDSVVIAKKDNVTYNTLVFPKQGIYFAYDTSERRVESLTINGYTGFVKPILKIESLTPHGHDWYGKVINKGNTVRSDDVIHDGFVKVSDAVPTLAEVQRGGTLRFYNVVDGELSGDLIVGNYLESPYSVVSSSGEIWIASDGIVMVQIKADGVYFRQDQYNCIHSLTINGYEGFNYNFEKIPVELIPDGISGGADWNAQEGEDGYIANKPFGETTVMGDTLTWDGNTEGLVSAMDVFYRISDCTPTLEELQQGGSVELALMGSAPFDSDAVIEMGENLLAITMEGDPLVVIALVDNAVFDDGNGEPISFEKAGIYSIYIDGTYTTSLTINNYTGFETTEIKTIDEKYLPNGEKITFKINSTNLGWTDDAVVSCDKSLSQLRSMAIDNLNGISISWENASEEVAICQPLSMSITQIGVSCTFGYVNGHTLDLYEIIYMEEGIQVVKVE